MTKTNEIYGNFNNIGNTLSTQNVSEMPSDSFSTGFTSDSAETPKWYEWLLLVPMALWAVIKAVFFFFHGEGSYGGTKRRVIGWFLMLLSVFTGPYQSQLSGDPVTSRVFFFLLITPIWLLHTVKMSNRGMDDHLGYLTLLLGVMMITGTL